MLFKRANVSNGDFLHQKTVDDLLQTSEFFFVLRKGNKEGSGQSFLVTSGYAKFKILY